MELDRAMHRALVEAGFAPLDEYLARWAPPPVKGITSMYREDPRQLPEWLQREAAQRQRTLHRERLANLAALAIIGALLAVFVLVAVPAISDWVEHNATPAWEGNR